MISIVARKVCLTWCLFAVVSVAAYADTNESGVNIPWGYVGASGPSDWSNLNPAFLECSKGTHQSPININKRLAKTPPTLSFHYGPAPLVIVDDGVTNLQIGRTQTVIADGHALQLNFPSDGAKEAIMLDDHLYRLIQLHVHEPSEHEIKGVQYPLEIHLVHQGVEGHVAVVGVLVKEGPANVALQKMLDHLPEDKGVEHTIEDEQVNPANLLPHDRAYYNYPGSLTTPPCSEGIDWIVMMEPITASASQMANLRRAIDGDNARPIQPLKARRIYYSKVRR